MNWQVVKQLVEYGRSQEEAHNKKFRFTLTTNGVLLNDEIMEFCNREMQTSCSVWMDEKRSTTRCAHSATEPEATT